MPTLVQLWQTADGKTFSSESAAKDHERSSDLAEYLRTYPGDPLGSTANDVAKYLLRAFEIVRKPDSRRSGRGGTPPAAKAT